MEVIQLNDISSCVPDPVQQVDQDMDLIEILWRQDIDLGVGKEVFDVNLRRELEKEQELELQKEQQKKEEKSEDDTETQLTELSTLNLVVDSETGELVPATEGQRTTETQTNLTSEQGLSIEEAIEILQEHSSPTQTTFSRQNSLAEELTGLLQSIPTGPVSRQVSFESRWNDVQDLISGQIDTNSSVADQTSLPTTSAAPLNNQATPLQNTSFPSQTSQFTSQNTEYDITQVLPSNQGALLQNASLAESMDTTELLAAMDATSLATPLNDTQPLFSLNNTDTALFANATINNSTNFLLDLLDENNIDDSEMSYQAPDNLFTPIKSEDQLSDSAVGSLGSTGSSSPYHSDSANSNMTSPFENGGRNMTLSFDNLEGATGGLEDFLNIPKETKTENEKYNFYSGAGNRPPQSNYQYPDQSNHSDSNMTDSFTPALQRHIGHNHTYPALPGQQPRERKCDVAARLMRNRTAADTSRDEKKAKKLQLPFTVEDIIHSPVEKFNEMLTKYKLTEPQLQLMKDIRRRGKNKVAAQNCRKRKMEVIETLEEEVEKMRQERDSMQRQRGLIDKERNKVRDKYNALYREVFNSLRDEHGQPYDPSEYTLQHTADGNVFLVPRNNTESESDQNKNKKKRNHKK